ncbi:MAG: anti-sigma factor [Chloroflexi bacterium]|nr:anti-sigma factor [Chloroflexota bacterium]
MNCDEIRDLLGAYAIGVATAEERAQVEGHLEECDLHQELRDLSAVSATLAFSVPEMAPPASLKQRLMAAASETQPAKLELITPIWRRLATAYAIAAVLAIAVGALAVWNITLQTTSDSDNFVHFYREGDGDWLRLETVLGEPKGTVSLGGLDRLESGMAYQLWATRGDEVISIGVFNTNPEGKWSGEFQFAFFSGDALWITVEPEQGSPEPTDEAVVRTRF